MGGFNLLTTQHVALRVRPKKDQALFGNGRYDFDMIEYYDQ